MMIPDRLFAWLMHRESAFYEPLVADRKAALLGGLGGTVVEIGPGTGVNLRYLGPGVTRWVGALCGAWPAAATRHTAEAIAAAGFSRAESEAFRLPLPVVAPHVAGWALR